MEELVMLLLGFGILLFFIAVVLLIIYILAYWMIFNKAGEPGWKALIPIYSTYTEYKLVWNTKMFAVFMAFAVATAILENMDGMLFLYYAASIGTIVMNIIACVKMSMSFGHGTGFAIGLILLNPIFLLILAFDGSAYIGPEGRRPQTERQGWE